MYRWFVVCAALFVLLLCGCDSTPPSTTKSISSLTFRAADNPTLTSDVKASISGTNIAAKVPYGTNVTALKATFATDGASVSVNDVVQTSGSTSNDFTSPVTYTVAAADGTKQDYIVTVTVLPGSAKDITAFSFSPASNPSLTTEVSATIIGTSITATVPTGTNVTKLVATFTTTGASVTVGSAIQTSDVTANDFTNPVTYVVKALDGSTQSYTATVKVAPSTAKDLTAFSFLASKNSGLSADVVGTINGTAVALTVPSGTNVTALVATFTTTGTKVAVGSTTQVSGTTANNFTNPVTYVVTAADASTKSYTVTVTIAPSSAKDITAYSFLSANNGSNLSADVVGTINGTSIGLTVPYGTNVTALVASFTATGQSVKVGTTAQVSGTTANDFTNPVTYTVTAADSSTKTFTVTVTVAKNSAKDITAFSFLSANNSTLSADVVGTINGTSIGLTVPYGTDVTALVATYTSTGQTVKVGSTTQVSDVTANDFTSPVSYVVTAADNSTKTFTVTVTIAKNTAKDITAFSFLATDNIALASDVIGNINGTAIAATVPYGTDVTALVATFASTGASVAVGTTTQVSGVTANDFTNPVTYVVTAADNSTKSYTVTVTVAKNTAKDITAFSFLATDNVALSADVVGNINGTAIGLTVPYGTDVTALVATYATTGATVSVGTTTQASGVTANDFTNPVTYVVTAADNSTKSYTVTVTIAKNTAKSITSFAFLATDNGGVLSQDVVGTISGNNISLTVPYGTVVTGLVAAFATTGQSVSVGTTTQASGITPNDFTNPVTYTVTAADNSTRSYTVTVTIALNTAKDLTAFSFLSANNGGNLSADVIGTINGTSVSLTVPYGTNVTDLVATFSTSGQTVSIGTTTQTSDVTANDFSNPVTYTVTAADSSTKTYTVTVTVALNSAKDITSFAFLVVDNPQLTSDVIGTINGTSISLVVPPGTDVTALVAAFQTTGASVAVGTTAQASEVTANDFTNAVTYTVTAANSSTQDYTVTVSGQ